MNVVVSLVYWLFNDNDIFIYLSDYYLKYIQDFTDHDNEIFLYLDQLLTFKQLDQTKMDEQEKEKNESDIKTLETNIIKNVEVIQAELNEKITCILSKSIQEKDIPRDQLELFKSY